ncbi:MAG: alpha/beta hydrolase, partial [Candidatus Omnitrophota bacterium]
MRDTSIPVEDLYSRIPYETKGDHRVFEIFYATNRTKDITYSFLDVKIDPYVRIGKMSPNRLKRSGIVGVQDIRKAGEDSFLKELASAVKNSPHHSLLVLVFGYKDNFEATAIKAAYFTYLLDVNTPVLLFDWPGDQPVSIAGYEKARSLATASGPYLGGLLAQIIRKIKPERLWIHSSSLGCQVVCDAFDYMYKHNDLSDKETEIAEVMLASPDVGQDEFDE